jgi:putative oxidoreductase
MGFLKQDDLAKLLLRVALGAMMLFHGIAKIGDTSNLTFIKETLVVKGMPEVLAYGIYIGEIVAPVLLILGLYSRIGGFLIVVNMLFAFWLMHMGDLFTLTHHGGWHLELQGFYLISGLCVLFLGSGKYALKQD